MRLIGSVDHYFDSAAIQPRFPLPDAQSYAPNSLYSDFSLFSVFSGFASNGPDALMSAYRFSNVFVDFIERPQSRTGLGR